MIMKDALKRLETMDPSDDMGMFLENVERIISGIEEAPGSDEAEVGLSLIRKKEKASRDYFMRPLDSDDVYNRLIRIHLGRGEENIANDYRRCLDLKQARKWTILGDSYALMGLNKKASEYLKRALYFGPAEDLVDEVRRTFEKAQKRVDKAEDSVSATVSKAQGDPGNLKNMVKAVSYLLDLDRLDEALELAERGIERHGDEFDLLYRKGVAFFGKGDLDAALEVFKRSHEMRPNSTNAKRAVNLSVEMKSGGL